jgi:hypothetical protein
MYTCNLIFSNQARYRLARHCILWVLYAAYFTVQSYYPVGVTEVISLYYVKLALLSTCLFLPFCFLSSYTLLYYLYPRFLSKERYGLFFLNLLGLLVLGAFMNFQASTLFIKYSDGWPSGVYPKLFLGIHNVAIGIIISGFLLGIKLGKNGYLQEKANLELARRKARTELQLLKTRIDPQFLFHSLHELQVKVNSGSADSPAAILELSDLLSAILYEPA